MEPSKYLERFKKFAAEGKEHFQLIGDGLLVEQIPMKEKKTASGLIVNVEGHGKFKNTLAADAPVFVHVVAVGEGYYDEEGGKDVPLNVKVGDIALVGAVSVKWFSMMDIEDYQPYEIGLCREAEIKCIFRGKESYDRALALLAPATEKKVEEGKTG